MLKIASQQLDVYHDPDYKLLKKAQEETKDLPEYVKATRFLTPEELQLMGDNEFALIISTSGGEYKRLYPILDPGHIWMSVYYFKQQKDKLPPKAQTIAAKNLVKAADQYDMPIDPVVAGISKLQYDNMPNVHWNRYIESTEKLMEKLRGGSMYDNVHVESPSDVKEIYDANFNLGKEKTAAFNKSLADDAFIYVGKTAAGQTERFYPIATESQVRQAVDYFDKYSHRMSPELRYKFATRLKKEAHKYNIQTPTKMDKYAEHRLGDLFDMGIKLRKQGLLDETKVAALDKIAEFKGKIDPVELAEALKKFDQHTKLSMLWDHNGMLDPYETVFGIVKQAFLTKVGNHMVSDEELMTLADEEKNKIVAKMLGPEVAEDIKSNPIEVFKSMPDPQKDILSQIIEGALN